MKGNIGYYCSTIGTDCAVQTRVLRQIPTLVTTATREALLIHLVSDWCGLTNILFLACKIFPEVFVIRKFVLIFR